MSYEFQKVSNASNRAVVAGAALLVMGAMGSVGYWGYNVGRNAAPAPSAQVSAQKTSTSTYTLPIFDQLSSTTPTNATPSFTIPLFEQLKASPRPQVNIFEQISPTHTYTIPLFEQLKAAPSPKINIFEQINPKLISSKTTATDMPILSQPYDVVPSKDSYVHVAPHIHLYDEKPTLFFNPGSVAEAKAGHYTHYKLKIKDAKGAELAPVQIMRIGEETRIPITPTLRDALDDDARFEVVALEETDGKFTPKASYRNGKFDHPVPDESLEHIAAYTVQTKPTSRFNLGTDPFRLAKGLTPVKFSINFDRTDRIYFS